MSSSSHKKEAPHATAEATASADASSAVHPAPAYDVVSHDLVEKMEQQAAEIAELKDRLLRTQAEWDNSRKRILKEKEEAVRYASEAFLEKLLPVIDNFEAGMQAAKNATDPKSIAQGFEMVLAQLQQVLRESGVEPVDAVGHPFDPHRHEALGHHESEEHPEGQVTQQMRKGYKLKDRLLRPASVFVAKAPETRKAQR